MTEDVIDKIFIGQVRLFWTLVKWFMLQYVLLFLVPCIGGCTLSIEVIACMATYTFLFTPTFSIWTFFQKCFD